MKKNWTSKVGQAIGIIIIACCIALPLWWIRPVLQQPTTVADIAFDVRRSRGTDFRIFIEEDGHYVPYLVLTADYGGNVLLLREYLLDRTMHFNPSPHGPNLWGFDDFGSYYPDSHIDIFLNTEFMDTLGESVITAMVASDIVITDKNSIGVTGRDSRVITRNVFLLSLRELGVPDPDTSVPEGETLRFFHGVHAVRVARFSSGTASPYWTRTPMNWTSYSVFTIAPVTIGFGPADRRLGVRPAFCVAPLTAITTRTDIINGETVFVLCTNNY